MAEPATKPLTFEEFVDLNLQGRYELVNGQLEELVAPRPRHGWTSYRIARELGSYLDRHQPDAYAGSELDIPTIPFFGRRPDFAYYSPADASRIDLENDRVLGVPTLVVEVLSPGEEIRDTVVKREEYARAGIGHYWILDPAQRTALLLQLDEDHYEVAAELSGAAALSSDLFPGLRIPLSRLFR